MRKFGVFILSHGRPDRVLTVDRLLRSGYTGPWHIVLDNEDPTAEDYVLRFGAERILLFSKESIAATFDSADLERDRRTVVYARNACFDLARELSYTHFLELDDDYTSFQHRVVERGQLRGIECIDLDRIFAAMLDYLDSSGAACVALAQGGDLIGGWRSVRWRAKILRKAMNTLFLRTDADWRFLGRVNEDVNTYTTLSHRGKLFFTTVYAMVDQKTTQANKGGMTDVYLHTGTYAKSFYTVLMCPSAVSIAVIDGGKDARIHHAVEWVNCAPKILSERYRKALTSCPKAMDPA
jgi:hypothetical protein